MKKKRYFANRRNKIKSREFESQGSFKESPEKNDEQIELQSVLQSVDRSFRDGFAERTTSRLTGILEKENIKEYYASLSRLLPKIVYGSAAVFFVLMTIIFVLHGEVNADVLLGTEKVNDSNFISYLIFENTN